MEQRSFDLPGLPARPRAQPLDWESLARRFAAFVTDPANRVRFTTRAGTTAFTAFLESPADNRHELTAFGPITLGLALLGEEIDWAAGSLQAYFDPLARVFLNNPGQPSVEWWYLFNINALAAHLILLGLANDESYLDRWRQASLRLVDLAHGVDYDFNSQGYDFKTKAAWTERDIFRQPDTIAAYAYLMLLASNRFGDSPFLAEARTALERYLAFADNPWYEIPSGAMGVACAAQLRSMGFDVDVEKAARFALDPRASLVLGEWGGEEVNGLVRGWRHSQPESAYSMESLVLMPYLLAAARKSPELARVVGKYALNTAANARLFYSGYAPHESRPDLPDVVAYERLYQEHGGFSPFAAGDFAGHKSIYGGAYALWWGALIHKTNDPFLPRIDLSRADFLDRRAYPTFLYYNPYPETRTVQVPLGVEPRDLYDPGRHVTLANSQTGDYPLTLPAQDARVVVYLPAGSAHHRHNHRVEVNGVPVDWGV